METMEDVLLEEMEVMTEMSSQKYLHRNREEVILSDKDIMRINELVHNRQGDDRFIPKGYLTIEECRHLTHEAINDVRVMLNQRQNAAIIY